MIIDCHAHPIWGNILNKWAGRSYFIAYVFSPDGENNEHSERSLKEIPVRWKC